MPRATFQPSGPDDAHGIARSNRRPIARVTASKAAKILASHQAAHGPRHRRPPIRTAGLQGACNTLRAGLAIGVEEGTNQLQTPSLLDALQRVLGRAPLGCTTLHPPPTAIFARQFRLQPRKSQCRSTATPPWPRGGRVSSTRPMTQRRGYHWDGREQTVARSEKQAGSPQPPFCAHSFQTSRCSP